MPLRHTLWTVGTAPEPVPETILPSENMLEEMIATRPDMLSDEWMVIGRQVHTDHGGFIDLLAIAPDASLIVIELKRNLTPRDVVAQGLDYASWVETRDAGDVAAIYQAFAQKHGLPETDLGAAFKARFGAELDEDEVNAAHQTVIVAASLDPATERIVDYLSNHDVPINVLFFQVYQHGGDMLLGRSWLIDPSEVQASVAAAPSRTKEPWNGEWYANFGQDDNRLWKDAREYGFISAGGGQWYTGTLSLPSIGDRLWVKVPKHGFVGVGSVMGEPVMLKDYEIDGRPAKEVLRAIPDGKWGDDPEHGEYVLPIRWHQTVALKDAINRFGMFGIQHTVCAPKSPKWRTTVDQLKEAFPDWEGKG